MKFFVPFAEGERQQNWVYKATKKLLSLELAAAFSDEGICRLEFRYKDGNHYKAEVGKVSAINGETVQIILYEPARSLYHVCTPTRGMTRDMPIFVGQQDVSSVEYFEGMEPTDSAARTQYG